MWTDYFKLKGIRRGRVITPSHGEIDFSRDDIPLETCRQLYEKKFPYLELTEAGKAKFYPEPSIPEQKPEVKKKISRKKV